ncbi:hypothetical protein GCM10010341_86880 [Streptomyces noursei]|nr:hypothetical protein GCM10010341_86880 [Streptomyces noursei]
MTDAMTAQKSKGKKDLKLTIPNPAPPGVLPPADRLEADRVPGRAITLAVRHPGARAGPGRRATGRGQRRGR